MLFCIEGMFKAWCCGSKRVIGCRVGPVVVGQVVGAHGVYSAVFATCPITHCMYWLVPSASSVLMGLVLELV